MLDNNDMTFDCNFYLAKTPVIGSSDHLYVLKLESLSCLDMFVTSVIGSLVDQHIKGDPLFYAYLSRDDLYGAVKTIKSGLRKFFDALSGSIFAPEIYETFPYSGEVVGDMTVDDMVVYVDENKMNYSVEFIILSVLKSKGFFKDFQQKKKRRSLRRKNYDKTTRDKNVQ